jgi:hypothetical protein
MHYDGWVQLPAAIRSKLALETKDELEITVTDGGILLRPAGAKTPRAPAREPEPAVSPSVPKARAAPVEPRARAMQVKASRGLTLPAGLRPRGRRKTAVHAPDARPTP